MHIPVQFLWLSGAYLTRIRRPRPIFFFACIMHGVHNKLTAMELQWIDDFLALEQTRNFTRAADMRATTQSAYSRRIQRLEDWLGVALFERAIRPVTLTVAGEDFLRRARRLREDIMDLRRNALASASGLVQSTRIYTTNTLAAGFFAGYAQQQKLANYALVVASVTACIEALRQKKAQMAIVPEDRKSVV